LAPTFENVDEDETKQKCGGSIVIYSRFLNSQAWEQLLEIWDSGKVVGFWCSFLGDDLCFLIKLFLEISG
jgi:hypothetical protein